MFRSKKKLSFRPRRKRCICNLFLSVRYLPVCINLQYNSKICAQFKKMFYLNWVTCDWYSDSLVFGLVVCI